jgi:hypothetical protein
MATAAQITANRANAQKSTGPRTAEGKTASSMNALKHGIDAVSTVIPGEDPEAYQRLVDEYYRDLRPAAALERFQVDTLIRSDWQRRRLKRIEANLYRTLLEEGTTPEEIAPAILRDSPTGKLLFKVIGQIASLERAYARAMSELRRLNRERQQAEIEAMEEALEELPPEAEACFAARREQLRQRNEAKSAPVSVALTPAENLALRL